MVSSSLFCCLRTRGSMRARAMSKTDLSNVDGFFQRQNTWNILWTRGNIWKPLDTYGIFWCFKPFWHNVHHAATLETVHMMGWLKGKSWKIYWEQSGNQVLTPTYGFPANVLSNSLCDSNFCDLIHCEPTLERYPESQNAGWLSVSNYGCRAAGVVGESRQRSRVNSLKWILGLDIGLVTISMYGKCRIHTPLTLGTTTAQRATSSWQWSWEVHSSESLSARCFP